MSILSGRNGTVKFDPAGITPVSVISLNAFKLSLKTDYDEVTCFGDSNKVYVPGLRDISGSLGGFWNSSSIVLFTATSATTPGLLELTPTSVESTYKFSGLAYIDADLDCGVKGAPKISGNFKAAGAWTEYP